MGRRTVLVATNNAHKLDELRTVFGDSEWDFMTLAQAGIDSDPEESGTTFLANARIKAKAAREAAHKKGLSVAILADDSGLEVDALDGRPGVFSARYAGEGATDARNNAKLLQELTSVPSQNRSARFKTVLVFLDEDGTEVTAEGTCEGAIGDAPHGEHGFGYDPLFLPAVVPGKTMAQLTQNEKNAISHRGNALRALREELA